MKKEKYNIIDDIEIPETMCESWQKTLDIIAKIVNVPVALMMRVHKTEIEVFLKSSNKENIYEKGEKAKLNTGLYCEYVMDKKKPLLVPNALKDKKWNTNPDIELNMISYLGYPILWPDNKIFGTICVLDSKENNYSKEYKELIEHFRDSIEHNLKDIYDTKRIGDELVDRHTKNLSFLSSSAKTLIELPLEEDIYSHIAKEISKLADNAIVSICSYNLDSNKVKVREIVGISKTIDKLRKLLNMKIMGNEFEINDVAIKKLSMAKLHKVDNGFSDMSTKFSKLQSKAVEKLFNMGDVYAMGFCRKNKLFGNFTIFLRKGQTLVKKDLIETFAKQATVALERRRAEIKLSESENKFSKLFHSSPNIWLCQD